MRKDYEKLFTHIEPPEPPAGLFDRIMLAIAREQELRRTRKTAIGFFALLIVSLTAAPFTWELFRSQMAESGIFQFLSIMVSDIGAFFAIWPNSVLAIAESLPVAGIAIFTVNVTLMIFTLRLFLYKKRLLVGYLFNHRIL